MNNTAQSMIARSAALALLFLGALCPLPTTAQTVTTRITGTFDGRASDGGFVLAPFTCQGEPVCTGTYQAVLRDSGCSHNMTRVGEIVISGLNLAQPGTMPVTLTMRGLDTQTTGNADGTCSVPPGAPLRDFVMTLSLAWDGTRGTIDHSFNDGANVRLRVDFTADRAAAPPVFPMVVRASVDLVTATAAADIQYRSQDLGTTQSVFVFAMAPASRVQGGLAANALKLGFAKDDRKADTPIGCVLAQLNAAGQMVAVTSANLAAYLTGVLGAQGASVSILNGVPTGNVSGATFFVGYGATGTAMINTGVNRAAVTVPGSLVCEPAAPETGWWWNPLEDGRGFSLEKRGNNLFFAAFLYDISGRSTWYVSSGPVSLEGTLYNGDLLAAAGGQTLGGPYSRFPTLSNAGALNITFNNARTGTIVWPGGTVPIQRFNIIANGITATPVAGVPESGWWWNESEAGRGFFMEWQGNTLDIAGYMYDDNGNPVWYLTVGEIGGTAAARNFNGTWWSYTGGQTLTGAWRQNTRSNSNVAPVTITFSGADTALMTLPNGRTTNLRRHRF